MGWKVQFDLDAGSKLPAHLVRICMSGALGQVCHKGGLGNNCDEGKEAQELDVHNVINRIDKCRSAPYLTGVSFGIYHGLAIHVILGLIIQNTETSHTRVNIGVSAVLASFISPILGDDYL